jgi:hypothetical protein
MTQDKFKKLLEEMEKGEKVNESEVPDFVQTCRMLLVCYIYAFDLQKTKDITRVFDKKEG